MRPIVGDIVDYCFHADSIRCAVVRDNSSALRRVNYDGSRASFVLVTENGVEGLAVWTSNDENPVAIVSTNWALRIFAILAVALHAAHTDRQRKFARTDASLAMLRSAGLL